MSSWRAPCTSREPLLLTDRPADCLEVSGGVAPLSSGIIAEKARLCQRTAHLWQRSRWRWLNSSASRAADAARHDADDGDAVR